MKPGTPDRMVGPERPRSPVPHLWNGGYGDVGDPLTLGTAGSRGEPSALEGLATRSSAMRSGG
jgi:hypothetical protein